MPTTSRPRDSQRSKFYAWIRTLPGFEGPLLTLNECFILINRVMEDFHCQMPQVKDGRGCRYPRANAHGITLPVKGRTLPVILEECAHVIQSQKQSNIAWHGPEFVRLFLILLGKYANLPNCKRSAQQAGLKVAEKGECPEPMSTEEKRLREEVRTARITLSEAQSRLYDYLREKGNPWTRI